MIQDHLLYREDLLRAAAGIREPERWRGAAWLITGATGLIGSVLTDALADLNERLELGMTVIALCRSAGRAAERFAAHPSVQVLSADLTDPGAALPAADVVIHAASNAHPAAFQADPVGTLRANLFGTASLLERLRAAGGGRFLMLSSGEVYGSDPDAPAGGFVESDPGKVLPTDVRSCYPEGKRAAEALCAAYAAQYGIGAVIARCSYTYGPTVHPANTRADAQFLRRALTGEDIVLKSSGSQLRSWCYTAECAGALLALADRGVPGEAYNVADRGGTATVREYAETLAGLAGVGLTFETPSDAERLGYSKVARAVQDPSKLEALGWTCARPLREGLARTLAILRGETRS